LDIESRAGGDELLDHERVALHRGQDERSQPAEKSGAGLSSVRPMQPSSQSAQGALPFVVPDIEFRAGGDELLDHEYVAGHRGQDERCAPAETAAASIGWRADDAVATRALPFVALDIQVGAGVD
jgi:hypothetical protein